MNYKQPDFSDFAVVDRGDLTPCWIPKRAPSGNGYCQIPDGKGKTQYAHRAYWEHFVGPIPEGHEVDHLCEQRDCCNPAHLEPVPGRVNRLRSASPPSLNERKTHCLRGHPFDEKNTYWAPNGRRRCRVCHRDRERARAAAKRADPQDEWKQVPLEELGWAA